MRRIAAHPWRTIGAGVLLQLGWIGVAGALYEDTPRRDSMLALTAVYAPLLIGSLLLMAGGATHAPRRERAALRLAAVAGGLQVVGLAWDWVNELRGSESTTYALPWLATWPLVLVAAIMALRRRRFARAPEAVRGPLPRRLGRGWREAAKSWRVLAGSRELLLLPACSFLLALAGWSAAFALAGQFVDALASRVVLASFAMLFPATCAGTFFGVAYLAALDRRLSGGHASVRDGLRVAWRRRGPILAWSLLAAGIGALIQAAQQLRAGWAAAPLLSWLAGAAWAVLTMFVLPVLALEDHGLRGTVRRSATLVRRRWGEGVAGAGSIGLVVVLATVAISVVLGIAVAIAGEGVAGDAVLVAGVVVIIALIVVSGVAMEILGLALYRYAAGRGATVPFTTEDLDRAMVPRRRWRR